MPSYTLLEYKLRRYFFLGNEHSIYVPPQIKQKIYRQENHNYLDGIKIIGNIVKKNKPEEINSIVPIILKVKRENILTNDQHLIFSLAICAKLTLNINCVKMVQDAYDAVSIVCINGLQLLMFVHFCKIVGQILYEQGFLQNKSSGFSRGFRKAICAWYLKRDPLKTTELVIRHKKYEGWTHKDIMKLVHIHSDDPCHQIYITHTLYGMQKVEEMFKSKLLAIQEENEKFAREQLTFIYNYLKQINNLKKMDVDNLQKDIGLNKWGEEFEVIPQKMLNNSKIINSLVLHMPLKTLLDNTFRFAKKKLFLNIAPQEGLWNFILRFNNVMELEKEKIHPIEAFIQFARYSRTGPNIIQIQNNIMKKQENENTNLPDDKLKVVIKSNKKILKPLVEGSSNLMKQNEYNFQAGPSHTKFELSNNLKSNFKLNKSDKNSEQPALKRKIKNDNNKKQTKWNENKVETSKLNLKDKKMTYSSTQKVSDDSNNLDNLSKQLAEDLIIQVENQTSRHTTTILLKPPPKLSASLIKFLSEELINKTLKILKPTGRHILISYDNRKYMKKQNCAYSHLIKAHEAVSLITLSIIWHEKSQSNKPIIVGLDDSGKPYNPIEIDYDKNVTYSNLETLMFKSSEVDEYEERNEVINPIHPLSIMDWAKGKQMKYDVFVFLGSNNMHLKNIKKAMKDYSMYLKKPIKVIVCCLNGKHSEQSNFGRSNTFLVIGFDKNVGMLIQSFINEEF
ncbi:uncharacterized protein LOC126895752 [Daktulosphaira vitifoliae]|uniref:uncharacterized protein LOC126895752 n=1 Tax=Daktulosphaira vitifoliae TaxID=58002 RepID=UPI0021AA40B4|nr:uncharacterized protein LOC126895752 [Daktulosphaira vitifoliae]